MCAGPVPHNQTYLMVNISANPVAMMPGHCWPRVWLNSMLLNTCDVKDVGYDELVALHGRCSMKLQQICLWTWYMPPGPLEIKEKSYLTDAPQLFQPRLLQCQYNIHAV